MVKSKENNELFILHCFPLIFTEFIQIVFHKLIQIVRHYKLVFTELLHECNVYTYRRSNFASHISTTVVSLLIVPTNLVLKFTYSTSTYLSYCTNIQYDYMLTDNILYLISYSLFCTYLFE